MNPYERYLEGREVVELLAETPERIRAVSGRMSAETFRKSYAPGKWDARQLLVHLVQTELAFGARLRMALSSEAYVVQPFDGDIWMDRESSVDGPTALEALMALRRFNLPLFRSLTPAERAKTFTHPERGVLPVGWVLELLAGHEIHHLRHLEQIAAHGAAASGATRAV